MKIKTIAVSNVPSMTIKLKESMDKYDIDYEIIECAWQGFYTKINEAYKYCKKHLNLDYILFVDAHDVIFIDNIISIENKIKFYYPNYDCIFSVEKECWPDASLADQYPGQDTPWKYLNSGSYLFKPSKLIEYVDANPIFIGMDDQLYFTQMYLKNDINCALDVKCRIFQSVAFEDEKDFSINGSCFINNITLTTPCVLHGNGHTDLTRYYNL